LISPEPPLNFSRGRGDFCIVAFEQLSFGEEPIFDIMSVFTAALLKQPVRAVADVLRRRASYDLRLHGPSGGAGCHQYVLHHFNFTISNLHGRLGIRRAADEQTTHALLKNTRFGEGPKQYPADLPIETRHLRSVGSGERHARWIDE
jgi:hypothetical protein